MSIEKISRVFPDPDGPTIDMKTLSVVKTILCIILGQVIDIKLIQPKVMSKMACRHMILQKRLVSQDKLLSQRKLRIHEQKI